MTPIDPLSGLPEDAAPAPAEEDAVPAPTGEDAVPAPTGEDAVPAPTGEDADAPDGVSAPGADGTPEGTEGGPPAAPVPPRRRPWGLSEAFLLCAGITAGGFAAGAFFGPPDPKAFKAPLNFALLGLAALPGFLRLAFPASRALRFLGGAPFASALICFFVAFALWMGLVPQSAPGPGASVLDSGHGTLASLGLFGLTASPPFAFLFLALLMSLSAAGAKGLLKPRKPVFVLNHLGLFLALAGLGLGASDRERHFMTVSEGHVEWRADAAAGGGSAPPELPVAVRLDDFDMEEYPASLALIDRNTGVPLPEAAPVTYALDGAGSESLPGFELEVLEFLPKAAPVGGGAFARAVLKASAQAARVRVRPSGGGAAAEGWVSSGSSMVPPAYMVLGEERVLVMTGAAPRRFVSKVKVFTREGVEAEREVEVNSPLTAGPWRVYQYGYDTAAGPMSLWSRFLLVGDRWRPVSRAGFVLWFLGAAGLVLSGRPAGKASPGTAPARRGAPAGEGA